MGEQKNICTFEQRNCAELNHVDEIPWAKDRPGLLWYKNNIKSNLEIQRTKRVKRIRLRRIQNPYGTCETIRGCHNRDKGTAENERLRDPKFIQYIKKVHAGIRILIISSILYYLIWTVLALDKAPAQSVFFESISTSVILLPVAALLGFDDNIWNILENKLPYINILFCCCFYIAVFSFWANYGIKWPMNASYKGIFSYWFTSTCIMTFIDFPKEDKRKLIYCDLLLIIAAAFITQSRAWVLQTLILLFIFVAVLGDRNRSVKILMGFLLIIITVLGVSYIFPEITGNLFNRGMEDTRSGQYVIFFAQHSWEDLIFGLGINASYSYLGNKNYSYFDNQFMFVMFHYGIFPVIAWLCAYASTLKGSKIYNEQSRIVIRAAKFVGFFVLLAYMGVSTYYQIELGYSGVIVMMLVGKALREKYYGRS